MSRSCFARPIRLFLQRWDDIAFNTTLSGDIGIIARNVTRRGTVAMVWCASDRDTMPPPALVELFCCIVPTCPKCLTSPTLDHRWRELVEWSCVMARIYLFSCDRLRRQFRYAQVVTDKFIQRLTGLGRPPALGSWNDPFPLFALQWTELGEQSISCKILQIGPAVRN